MAEFVNDPTFTLDFPFKQWYAIQDLIVRFPNEIASDYEDFRSYGERTSQQLLREQIYNTPQRGRYVRTRRLLNSMKVTKAAPQGNLVLSFTNSARSKRGFPYAIVNELGNIQGKRDGKTLLTVTEVRDAARRRVNQNEVPQLRYPRQAGVLEPRPFALPAAAATERRVFARLSERVQELGRRVL